MIQPSYPIIDTHRHLGGSISPQFVWQVIKDYDLKELAENPADVVAAMTFVPGEPPGFYRFLNKFTVLDRIPWDEELVDRSVFDVCNSLQREQIDYCWMDFSISKYMNFLKMTRHDVILHIHAMFEKYRPGKVGLVLSLKYESPRSAQKQYAELIHDPDIARCFVGIDLVGDEEYFDAEFYTPLLHPWREAGKMVRAHVAESQKAENALDAITKLRVTNIAHGLKLVDHGYMIDEALLHNICFDLGLTSNYVTGVWTDQHSHPIQRMLSAGLRVTLGTDDPIQCATTLQREFEIAQKWFGISTDVCQQMQNIAICITRDLAGVEFEQQDAS